MLQIFLKKDSPVHTEVGDPVMVQQCLRMDEYISVILSFGVRKAITLLPLDLYPQ